MTDPGAKTVRRALSLLKAFTDERPAWTLRELAAQSGLSKPTVHRLLAALEGEGYLTRTPSRDGYRLGPEAVVLGARALRAIDLREIARGELEALSARTGLETTLEILAGTEVLIIDDVPGGGVLGITPSTGTRWPAHATSTGKVLMAFSSEELPLEELDLRRCTDRTLHTLPELRAALEEIRKLGYATNLEELEEGVVSVAAPVRDQEGKAQAAISLGGPIHRAPPERIPELAELVREAASRIERNLGFVEEG